MMINNKILVVYRKRIKSFNINTIRKSVVGEKAMGLLSIPIAWTSDFFVVSKNLLNEYITADDLEKINILNDYSKQMIKALSKTKIENEFMLRSSALQEGMKERGHYESLKSSKESLIANLKILLDYLVPNCGKGIAIVVQAYIAPILTGHMSNERRFYSDARDWKIEYYYKSNVDHDQICIREWRKKFNTLEISNQQLICPKHKITYELRKVAYYWYQRSRETKRRYHLEFVYNGKQVYIVQADYDQNDINSVNPTEYNVKVKKNETTHSFKILKEYNYDASHYNKLNNVKIYKDLNLPTVPLYYLDDQQTIKELSSGYINDCLESDIRTLLNIQSIVIRIDINSDNKKEKQMLPRSNEMKNFDLVKSWLIEHCKNLLDENGILIIHNFVPAVSSAFVHAKPNSNKIEIQSLWGLPEGLYYNSHDTIIVNLPFLKSENINKKDIYVSVKRKFKDSFVYANPNGNWEVKNIIAPYDWECSIRDKNSIYDIAIQSQKLCDFCKQELSIMWFVDIDEEYYGAKNLPWFHESFAFEQYTRDEYKIKYFKDEEFTLKIQSDLEYIKSNKSKIKCIRIKPIDEIILRNKDFLQDIGKIACENGFRILLEGAQLSHPYYQLRRTGANVVCIDNDEFDITNDLEFNKLVRDKIPEKITSNGEKVKCGIAQDDLFDRILLEKLLEETFEVKDAKSTDEICEELADVSEVIIEIKKILSIRSLSSFDFYKKIFVAQSSSCYSKILNMEISYIDEFSIDEYNYVLKIIREKTEYRIELNIGDLDLNNRDYNKSNDDYNRDDLVHLASRLLASKSYEDQIECVELIDKRTREIITDINFDYSKLEETRRRKKSKNGGFKYGYVLIKTSLSDNIIDNNIEFNPNECIPLYTLKKNYNKYSELLKDEKKKQKKLVLRFNLPIAINDTFVEFSNSKITEFFGYERTITFSFEKDSNHRILLSLHIDDNYSFQMEF